MALPFLQIEAYSTKMNTLARGMKAWTENWKSQATGIPSYIRLFIFYPFAGIKGVCYHTWLTCLLRTAVFPGHWHLGHVGWVILFSEDGVCLSTPGPFPYSCQ